ncbi:MAG TPA: hypothetical protein VEO54_02690 [Thermoanaerobaculia bacterium]|nr:hypothetical protein [Thermoanaerobaculia bacterium]
MSTFLEAMLLLLPPDAGGRSAPVAPREGSYRPFARHGPRVVRARLFEGPPLLGPGEEDRVVLELESDIDNVRRGVELQILESEERVVGVATVLRVCTG